MSRDIQDMTMEDHAHGPGWLCHQRRARGGPHRQGGVRSPRHLPQLAVRADRSLPGARRGGTSTAVETTTVLTHPRIAGDRGRDRGVAQGADRARRRCRCSHDPLPPADPSPPATTSGAFGGDDLAGPVPTRVRDAATAQAAEELVAALPGRAAERVLAGRHHPTGPSPTAPTSRSSTSRTTTPACSSPRSVSAPPRRRTWSRPSTSAPRSWVCRPRC